MIVDLHTHIFPPDIAEHRDRYVERDACFAELYSNPKSKLATAEDLIASMDQSGIDMSAALNIGWSSHELCMQTNDYILAAARRYPDRLVPFCSIQPRAPGALAELDRCAAGGARGLGEMRPDVQGFDLVDPGTMDGLVDAAVEHDFVFLTHASEPVGHHYPGKGTVTPDLLYTFIARYPQLKVICAHWGGGLPFYALMPEVHEALANTYFDTAATHLLYKPSVFQTVVHLVGADRVLFGSDFPLVSQSRAADYVRACDPGPETEAAILGGNAQCLLGYDRQVKHGAGDTRSGV
ncbi:MAG: amidohydrolase family protein [Chloroflexota bacterium]